MEQIDKIEKIDKRKKNGGRRPGSGRKKNQPNHVTRSLKEAAQQYTEEALEVLVQIMRGFMVFKTKDGGEEIIPIVQPEQRAKAAQIILDRGHGKPSQTVEGIGDGGAIIVEIVKFGANAKD